MPIHLEAISRRRFLAGSGAVLAGMSAPGRLLADAAPADPHMWALLADTHVAPLDAFKGRDRKAIDRAKALVPNLKAVVRDVLATEPRPAGLVLNGDCVEYGTPEDYRTFLGAIDDLGESGIPLRLTLGNHDDRPRFLEQAPRSLRYEVRSDLVDRLVSVIPSERANWFLLDSLAMEDPDRRGVIGQAQLAWLSRALDEHGDRPALVVVHHNVHPSPGRLKGAETIVPSAAPPHQLGGGLADSDEFLDVLFARKHVKACFCGHKHQFRVHRLKGVYFVFQPAVGFPFHPADAIGWMRVRLAQRGADLELRALSRGHQHHLKRLKLQWA